MQSLSYMQKIYILLQNNCAAKGLHPIPQNMPFILNQKMDIVPGIPMPFTPVIGEEWALHG